MPPPTAREIVMRRNFEHMEPTCKKALALVEEIQRGGGDVAELLRREPGLVLSLKVARGEYAQITDEDFRAFKGNGPCRMRYQGVG